MEEFAFQRALGAVWEFIGLLNRYIDSQQPWTLGKDATTRGRLDAVLYTLGEALRCLGIILAPFLPEAARRIRGALGQTGDPHLADCEWGRLVPGARVEKMAPLFPRVEEPSPSGAPRSSAAPAPAGADARATMDEFARLDLRVAEVIAAEAVPRSRKLVKLTVSLGAEQRTVVAGIAEHYTAADLVGKKVVVVANLEPATLMGVESQGMLLAGSAAGRLAVLTVDRDLPPGAKVK
jgi:methionyl-tRNA synthetase